MNDCPNAAIRDQLPDLVHDQLDADTRSMVLAHVAVCAECESELSLLRQMRLVLSRESTVNVGQIVRALPSPSRVPTRKAVAGSVRRIDWRIAAAVAFLAVGGASVATYSMFGRPLPAAKGVPHVRVSAGPTSESDSTSRTVAAALPAAQLRDTGRGMRSEADAPMHPAELAMADGYTDMSDSELQALLGEIDRFQAVPPAEPDPVTVRMTTGNPGSY